MKKLLTGVLAVGFVAMAGNAIAAIDLNLSPTGAPSYASEITIAAAGTNLIVNSAVLGDVGFGSNSTDVRYFRYDLSNEAQFTTAPELTVETACTLSQTGADDDYVIFTCAGQTYGENADASLAVDELTVFNQSVVSLTMGQYDNINGAQTKTGAIGSASGTILNFTSGVTFAPCDIATPATPIKLIDVTEGSLQFDEADVSVTGAGCIDLVAVDGVLWSDSVPVVLSDMFAATSVFELTAPAFTAAAENGVEFGTVATGYNSAVIDADDASLYTIASGNTGVDNFEVVLTVTGEDLITKGFVKATFVPVPAEGSSIGTLGPITLADIQKNGTTDRISFSLTPGGAFPYYVRVTNPSSIAGAVFFTVFNDAGDSVSFDVAAVAGIDGLVDGDLPAGASTNLITIEKIFAAAQAADATFDVANVSEKLRIDVEAEFGTDSDPVIGNAFSLSSDGTTFNMVQ